MQAIRTKYIGPTNTRGSRIKASCEAGSVTVGYEYGAHDPHEVAMLALVAKLGWTTADGYPPMVSGSHGDAQYWVFLPRQESAK